jgi:hypothetical protein
MKIVQYIMLPVLTGLLFVACNTEPKGPSQAELDTQVEAKVKLATDQLKADCDNRIKQAAQAQADSLLAAAKPTAKPVTKPITPAQPIKAAPATPKVTETPTPPVIVEQPKGGLKGLSDQAKEVQGNSRGLKGLSDQAKQEEIKKENKKGGLKALQDKK